MCTSAPDIPPPPPPVAPPPPPTETAKKVENKGLQSRQRAKKRGAGALTVRRPSVNTGSSGSGARMSY